MLKKGVKNFINCRYCLIRVYICSLYINVIKVYNNKWDKYRVYMFNYKILF